MIWIFHRERADAASVDNYDDLFQYINLKLLESHLEFGQIPWSFTFFTPCQVSVIYAHTEQLLLTEIVKEAYEKELGLIAICQGDFDNPVEILATPDVDIEALKKQWCLAYCDAHDYIVVDNFSHPPHSAQSQWQSESAGLSNKVRLSQELHDGPTNY